MKARNTKLIDDALRKISYATEKSAKKWFRLLTWVSPISVLLGMSCNASADQDWNWLTANGNDIPSNAVVGGNEGGKVLYICRADYQNGTHPGKVRQGFGGCNIGWGGKEITVSNYQVLIPSWVSASNGSTPPGSTEVGNEANNDPNSLFGDPLFACSANYNSGTHPGKVRQGLGGCNIGWGGKEITVPSYRVLTTQGLDSFSGNQGLDSFSGNVVLSEALAGGSENGKTLYICIARYNNGTHPGKFRAGLGGCNIGWGGNEITVSQYSFLVPHWETSAGGWFFEAGRDSDGSPLYVCRAAYSNGIHPGKYRQEFGGCNIGFGGKEITVSNYAVLSRPPPPR